MSGTSAGGSVLAPGIERILFTEAEISHRIAEVGEEISARYEGRTLKLICVLKGSVFFLTALARQIRVPVKIDFLAISSFSNRTGTPGVVQISKDLDEGIEGEDVLLIEDIVDTGFTLRFLLQTLAGRGPKSLSVCTLLDRNASRIVKTKIDFRCFEIPDRFVVGFGLDHNQLYRNLPYLAILKLGNRSVPEFTVALE
jgi:hypoxanthine phosphoribosyltransferase